LARGRGWCILRLQGEKAILYAGEMLGFVCARMA